MRLIRHWRPAVSSFHHPFGSSAAVARDFNKRIRVGGGGSSQTGATCIIISQRRRWWSLGWCRHSSSVDTAWQSDRSALPPTWWPSALLLQQRPVHLRATTPRCALWLSLLSPLGPSRASSSVSVGRLLKDGWARASTDDTPHHSLGSRTRHS